MKKLQRLTALFLVLVMMGALLSGCGAQINSEEIKIGEITPLTGGASSFGQSMAKGIDLAVEEVNAKGGILDKKVVLIKEDGKSEPAESANAAKKLIEQDGVVAIIGETASSNSLAVAPIAQASRVPMVTPTSTNPQVTEVGDYIFRVCFIDPFQGVMMSKFAVDTLKVKKAAIFTDVTSDYSKGLAEVFKANFTKLGGDIVAEESYVQKDTDFNAQLTKIKAAKPEVIFIPGYYTEVGLIAKQARQLGLTQALLGADGWDSPKLTEIAGNATNNSFFSNHYSTEDKDPVIQEFVAKFQKKYNQDPDAFAVLGYEAAMMLLDSIKRAGTVDKAAIRDALAATKDFQGVTGKISIDEKRNPVKSAVVLEMKAGKQNFVEKVTP